MISLDPTLTIPREAGVVYTKPWMVELVLDLAGYLPEKRLAERVALEPSAGDGAFLSAMVPVKMPVPAMRFGLSSGRGVSVFAFGR